VRVAVKGIDVYDSNTGDIRSNDVRDIAAWFIDTRGLSGSFRHNLAVAARSAEGPFTIRFADLHHRAMQTVVC
jgi:hypothetical protein